MFPTGCTKANSHRISILPSDVSHRDMICTTWDKKKNTHHRSTFQEAHRSLYSMRSKENITSHTSDPSFHSQCGILNSSSTLCTVAPSRNLSLTNRCTYRWNSLFSSSSILWAVTHVSLLWRSSGIVFDVLALVTPSLTLALCGVTGLHAEDLLGDWYVRCRFMAGGSSFFAVSMFFVICCHPQAETPPPHTRWATRTFPKARFFESWYTPFLLNWRITRGAICYEKILHSRYFSLVCIRCRRHELVTVPYTRRAKMHPSIVHIHIIIDWYMRTQSSSNRDSRTGDF